MFNGKNLRIFANLTSIIDRGLLQVDVNDLNSGLEAIRKTGDSPEWR